MFARIRTLPLKNTFDTLTRQDVAIAGGLSDTNGRYIFLRFRGLQFSSTVDTNLLSTVSMSYDSFSKVCPKNLSNSSIRPTFSSHGKVKINYLSVVLAVAEVGSLIIAKRVGKFKMNKMHEKI